MIYSSLKSLVTFCLAIRFFLGCIDALDSLASITHQICLIENIESDSIAIPERTANYSLFRTFMVEVACTCNVVEVVPNVQQDILVLALPAATTRSAFLTYSLYMLSRYVVTINAL